MRNQAARWCAPAGSLHKLLVAHEELLLAQDPPAPVYHSADKSVFSFSYANASSTLHIIANDGKTAAAVALGGGSFFVAAGAHLLLGGGGGGDGGGRPRMLFNTSAVGGN
eukprot:SAG11_NODE_15216_length_585_cov_0.709877_1_plen_109_part_01